MAYADGTRVERDPVTGAPGEKRLSILALEPYYGGSHRAVLDTLVEYVDADWHLLTLPARKWKWRMRGAAITFASQADALSRRLGSAPFDLVFASTFLNLAEWRGLVPPPIAAVPAILYFHENQLVYPNRHTAEWDLQFPLTNITSALSAERCVFNTEWNRDRFLAEIPAFIRQFPDCRPSGLADRIAEKSEVLHPPFDPTPFDAVEVVRGDRCRIVLAAPVGARQEPRGVLLGGRSARRGGTRLRGRGRGAVVSGRARVDPACGGAARLAFGARG